MTSQGPTCACCGKPLADGAYACVTCGITKPGEQLRQIADMTPAARDIAHGLSRRGGGGAGGKPGSRLPLDLGATSRLDAVANALGGWVRHVAEERGSYPASVPAGFDVIGPSARFIAEHLEWMRHRPEVDEFLADIAAAARIVAGIARGPAAQRYLGPCGAVRSTCEGLEVDDWPEADCGDHTPHLAHDQQPCDGDIYAREGASVGRCRTCGAEVSTDLRRAWLDDEVRAHAFTARDIADAHGINVKTIRTWATRGSLKSYWRTEAGIVADWADPPEGETRERLHYVGDVLDLAAADAARRAEAQAKRARRAETHGERMSA